MKLPKFPWKNPFAERKGSGKNSPDKKKPGKPQIAAMAIILGIALGLNVGKVLFNDTETEMPWAYEALPYTQEITLSQAMDILKEDANGRRAAVMGYTMVIETKPGAGNDPDRLMAAYDAREDMRIEAAKIAAEEAKEAGQSEQDDAEKSAETDDVLEAAAKLQAILEAPYEVKPVDIELDVVRARFTSYASGFVDDLVKSSSFDVEVLDDPELGGSTAAAIVNFLFPVIMICLLCFFLFTTMGGRGNFGTSKSFKVIKPEDLKTGLDDVAGIGIAKGDIEEVVAFMKNPEEASRLGGRMPRGALFDGPPGTGKTLLAKAVAKEAGVTFIEVDASSLSALYVGLGAIKVRGLFKQARKLAPCILFIDEIDAMAKRRGSGGSTGNDEKENTLNAILTELDGFESRDGIFVIGATNRPEILDPALTRPGRIDRRITMTVPDIAGREEILQVHTREKPIDTDVDLRAIASSTYGLTGAQLENLVNEAALNAGRNKRTTITMEDFRYGRDRSLLPRSSSQIHLAEDDRHLTAVHEAGHAVIAAISANADPIEKATILPQGNALGFVMQAPDRDFVFHSKARLIDRIRVAVAGRAAEKLVFGNDLVTTGAASDIQQATAVARAMVTRYGMSEAGFVEINPQDPVLCETQGHLLKLIRQIIEIEQEAVDKLLLEHRSALDAVTTALEDRETLSGAELREIIASAIGKAPPPEPADAADTPVNPIPA